MGAALTSNILRVTTDVVATISTKILLKTKLSTDTSQVISVTDVHGDVHIVGNRFYQTATINMKALMKALSSEAAQQEIMTEIAQAAKSLASGINLGQYADAENLMNLLVKSTIALISNMETSCGVFISQDQEIIIERVKGNVYIQNNVFYQVQNIFQDCVERATSGSSSFQQLEEKLKQEATAKVEGISGWIFVAILAVFIGAVAIGGKYVLKFLFPLIFVAGAVLLVLYFAWTYGDLKVIGYTRGIQKLCGLTPAKTFDSPNSTQTRNTCVNQAACRAYDWRSYKTDGKFVPVPPKGYIYNRIPDSCITELNNDTPDSSPVTRVPKFESGMGAPKEKGSYGDAYLDKGSAFWYQLNEQLTWAHMGTFVPGFHGVIDWGAETPKTGVAGQYFVTYDPTNPIKFSVLRRDDKGQWVSENTFKGPGLIPDAHRPNVTGYKYRARRMWALYGGIAGLAVGALGSIYVMTAAREDETNPKTYA